MSLEALDLPDPAQPEIDAWIDGVSAGLSGGAPAETVLVGHSVGCRAVLGAVFDGDVRVASEAKHFNAAREPTVLAAIRELCSDVGN